jgi:hypothetical protein
MEIMEVENGDGENEMVENDIDKEKEEEKKNVKPSTRRCCRNSF